MATTIALLWSGAREGKQIIVVAKESTSPKGLVLVTGASGFIAGHCIQELLKYGYAVRGTVRSLASREKTAHLDGLAERTGGSLELVAADLDSDRGWSDAVAGCSSVLHVASPIPAELPDDENDLIRPAVDGTLRVLRASVDSGTVRRVVLTSSVAAIAYGHDRRDTTLRTEEHWSNADGCAPYEKSKTLAEQAAWQYVNGLPEDQRIELVAVNPGLVLGPLLRPESATSLEVVRKLLNREMPASPRIGFATVDVRDLAVAHRLAMETPAAAGNRYICAGDHIWMQDIARILAAEFNPMGLRVPTGALPYWIMWVLGRFDRTVRLALGFVGRQELVSRAKATEELGWTMRPAAQTILDTGRSLIEYGMAPAVAAATTTRPNVAAA